MDSKVWLFRQIFLPFSKAFFHIPLLHVTYIYHKWTSYWLICYLASEATHGWNCLAFNSSSSDHESGGCRWFVLQTLTTGNIAKQLIDRERMLIIWFDARVSLSEGYWNYYQIISTTLYNPSIWGEGDFLKILKTWINLVLFQS